MSGLDTMLQTIRDEAGAEARAVLDQARAKAARLLEEAKAATTANAKSGSKRAGGRPRT
jgi:vacuolar-type H+-ATPase subunit E/Vma4